MKLAPHRSLVVCLALWLPALLPMLGCGRAAYEADVDGAIARLKIENQFRTLDAAPIVLAAWKLDQSPTGTKVTFRKPAMYIGKPFDVTTMNTRTNADLMKPERLRPPFLLNFPGFVQTWEKIQVINRNDSVAMLYVGAQVAEPGLTDRVLGELKAALPDLPDLAWGTIDVQTPEGKNVRWNILSFDCEQDFWHLSDAEPLKLNGTFLLLIREEQGRQVCLGCRWSQSAVPQARRQEVLAAAGTVQVALGVKID